MEQLASPSVAALAAAVLLLLSMLWMRRRQAQAPRKRREDRLDTVQAWPAQLIPVMAPAQRAAYDLLRQALPESLVLTQVQLAHFLRVPTRHSYAEWYRRAGRLRVGFLVCDLHSRVVAAVDLRLANESARELARHQRLVRVLAATGLPVEVWTEDDVPSLSQVRHRFAALLGERAASAAVAPVALDPAEEMSGALEVMSVEATDFGDLGTLPAPLDEEAVARPRHWAR